MGNLNDLLNQIKENKKAEIEREYLTALSGYRLFPIENKGMVEPPADEIPLECGEVAILRMEIYRDYLVDNGDTVAIVGNKSGGVNHITIEGYNNLIMCAKRYGAQNYIAKTGKKMEVDFATTVEDVYAVDYQIVPPTI